MLFWAGFEILRFVSCYLKEVKKNNAFGGHSGIIWGLSESEGVESNLLVIAILPMSLSLISATYGPTTSTTVG